MKRPVSLATFTYLQLYFQRASVTLALISFSAGVNGNGFIFYNIINLKNFKKCNLLRENFFYIKIFLNKKKK